MLVVTNSQISSLSFARSKRSLSSLLMSPEGQDTNTIMSKPISEFIFLTNKIRFPLIAVDILTASDMISQSIMDYSRAVEWSDDELETITEEKLKERIDAQDYTLLDFFIRFLDDEEPLPTLCGYFKRLFSWLCQKHKHSFLKYLFIAREGQIFDSLAKHIEN